MNNSGRRQVRTPVGNKTKRGAELEGTPKTPRSFEASPCKSTCVDSFSQEPEDQRLQLKSRRPLQWNNLAKQGIDAMAAEITTEDLLENTLSPFLHGDLKSTGESEAVAALSPICMNAIRGNSDQQGGRIKAAVKKPNEMPSSLVFSKKRDCHVTLKRKGRATALEDAHWNASEDHGETELIDAGLCLSSPECRISPLTGEQIFLWSNAAFNQRPALEETVCISKDTASSTSCSSAGSCARQKAAITERADCEAESKTTNQPKTDGSQSCNAKVHPRESPIVDATADAKDGISNSEFSGPGDQETKPCGSRGECTEISESPLARKLLFENDESSSCGLVLEPDYGAFPYLVKQRSETKEFTDLQKSIMQAAKKEEERLEIGLEEIEQEIQHLTERLTELQLQKRMRVKEMRRHGEENTKKAETVLYVGRKEAAADKERSVVDMQQQGKRLAVTRAKRGKGAVSISSSSVSVLQSPRAQSLRSYHEETPVSSREQCPPTGSANKLSELRRSVSSASRRMESSNRSSDAEADRSKVLRRLSMSGSMMSSPSNVKGYQRSFSSKGSYTPSRVVSSRYGRAITPDACRPSGGSTLACKKRDRPFSAASSSLPQPPAAVVSSPLKKVATLRSGYPSRSGFTTPSKERQQLKPRSAMRTASNTSAPWSSPSSLRAQTLGHLLHSPTSKSPLARIDSPKSTAALYKCLESLLEDSKHFFKCLSPARSHHSHSHSHSHTLPQQLESTLALSACLQPCKSLPNINTCRMDTISPRDSGCVKRVCDRQKRHFFFGQQQSLPRALE